MPIWRGDRSWVDIWAIGGPRVKRAVEMPFFPGAPKPIGDHGCGCALNHFGYSGVSAVRTIHSFGSIMRPLFALVSCPAPFFAASFSSAFGRDPRVHHRQSGRRLRRRPVPGAGREMRRVRRSRAYCQSREFAQATAYRRVDPDEVTGSVPKSGRRKLPSWRLRRIRRNHLPALILLGAAP